jgi:hypothetical protein
MEKRLVDYINSTDNSIIFAEMTKELNPVSGFCGRSDELVALNIAITIKLIRDCDIELNEYFEFLKTSIRERISGC